MLSIIAKGRLVKAALWFVRIITRFAPAKTSGI